MTVLNLSTVLVLFYYIAVFLFCFHLTLHLQQCPTYLLHYVMF